MVAAMLATISHGGDRRAVQAANLPLVSQERAATALNVGDRSVRHAVVVRDSGDDALIAAVRDGMLAVSKAVTIARERPEFRAAALARITDDGIRATEAIRQTRKQFLPSDVAKLPDGIFRLIYSDPPWEYNDARRTDDHRQCTGAFDQYGDMALEEICALDVKSIAADDSVLLMWGTFPLMPQCLRVIEAWGFAYKTAFIWDKRHGSFGNYHDAEAELLFVATRGSCVPDLETKEKQIQRWPRGRHSAKPEMARALIDKLWPHGPRVELFRRGPVPPGWKTWGAEATRADPTPAADDLDEIPTFLRRTEAEAAS